MFVFTESRKELTAKYFSDVSKLIFAATVLGFFVHTDATSVSLSSLMFGAIATILFFLAGVIIKK